MQKTLRACFPLFMLPGLICFLIAFFIPLCMGLYLSFCRFTNVTNAQWVGIENYIRAFDRDFYAALIFTVKFTLVSLVSINIFAFAFALMLTWGLSGTSLFRTVFFMPNLIGGIVLGWIWQVIINGVLYRYDTTLVSNPAYGFWGLVVLMNWQNAGYMMVIYNCGHSKHPSGRA